MILNDLAKYSMTRRTRGLSATVWVYCYIYRYWYNQSIFTRKLATMGFHGRISSYFFYFFYFKHCYRPM